MTRKFKKIDRYVFPCTNGRNNIKILLHFLLDDKDPAKYSGSNDTIMPVASVILSKTYKGCKDYIIFADDKDFYISYGYDNCHDVLGIYRKKELTRKVRIRTKYITKLGSNVFRDSLVKGTKWKEYQHVFSFVLSTLSFRP